MHQPFLCPRYFCLYVPGGGVASSIMITYHAKDHEPVTWTRPEGQSRSHDDPPNREGEVESHFDNSYDDELTMPDRMISARHGRNPIQHGANPWISSAD